MKVLVAYESLYGNTASIADTIGEAIGKAIASNPRSASSEVEVCAIPEIAPEQAGGFGLLVVGGPTHAHGMSHASTRRAGAEDDKNTFPTPTVEPGIRAWLEALPAGAGRLAAAFDTRFDMPTAFTGSAAKGIARKLKHHGFKVIAPPESFFVTKQNRLEAGQLEHAAAWGTSLAERAMARTAHPSSRAA
jgi:hypothetical protein